MLEKMLRDDLCIGMRVTSRSGADGIIKTCSVRFEGLMPIMIDDFTDDLFYAYDGDEEHDLDIMRVLLPSGAVLWERQEVELRVFESKLWNADADVAEFYKTRPIIIEESIKGWVATCDGKLCTFKPSGTDKGLCNGYGIHRDWTRALTDDERKTWGKRK